MHGRCMVQNDMIITEKVVNVSINAHHDFWDHNSMNYLNPTHPPTPTHTQKKQEM